MLHNCRSAMKNKLEISDTIIHFNLDVLILRETWFNDTSHSICDRVGGGIAIIFKDTLQCREIPNGPFSSFQFLTFNLHMQHHPPFRVNAIYHPPGDNTTFIDEFLDLASDQSIRSDKLIFLGDFNLHWGSTEDPLAIRLATFLDENDLAQCKPMHTKGSTLDLLISRPSII